MQNFSYENEFDWHENGRAGETNFHKNSFARRLVLTQRQTRTRKWSIKLTTNSVKETSQVKFTNKINMPTYRRCYVSKKIRILYFFLLVALMQFS